METDIIDRIRDDFGVSSEKALELLEVFELTQGLSPRVTRCIVALSNGDILELNKWIEEAKTDWRDVVDEAEQEPFQYKNPFSSL